MLFIFAGTSTLSLLLDLPPSTPGGPLPRLSDLPGPSYENKEQEVSGRQSYTRVLLSLYLDWSSFSFNCIFFAIITYSFSPF